MTGTVKWFDDVKGYGFIIRDDGKGEIFVHHSAIQMTGFRRLEAGEPVTFSEQPGKTGPKAKQVERIAANGVA